MRKEIEVQTGERRARGMLHRATETADTKIVNLTQNIKDIQANGPPDSDSSSTPLNTTAVNNDENINIQKIVTTISPENYTSASKENVSDSEYNNDWKTVTENLVEVQTETTHTQIEHTTVGKNDDETGAKKEKKVNFENDLSDKRIVLVENKSTTPTAGNIVVYNALNTGSIVETSIYWLYLFVVFIIEISVVICRFS